MTTLDDDLARLGMRLAPRMLPAALKGVTHVAAYTGSPGRGGCGPVPGA